MSRDPGYAVFERVLEPARVCSIAEALRDPLLPRTRAGARHLLSVPAVEALASAPELTAIAARFVGPAAVPFRATLFEKAAGSGWLVPWHQDRTLPLRRLPGSSTGWGPFSVKAGVLHAHAPAEALERVIALRIHLDDSTAMNGPLRVLPQTHTRGVLAEEEIDRLSREIAGIQCLAAAGGVVAMRPLLVHASSKPRDLRPRRVLHIEYAPGEGVASGAELAVC